MLAACAYRALVIDPWGVGCIREIGTIDDPGTAPELLEPEPDGEGAES